MLGPVPTNTNPISASIVNSFFTNTIFLKNGSTVKFGTGSATFKDELNLTTVMIADDTLLEAMAEYLSKQDATRLARFVQLFAPACGETQA